MPLRKSKGNMYDWVSHTHSHLGGECQHHCSYCYVDNPRFGRPEKYTGPIRLIKPELDVRYGEGKTIFIENCGDLFSTAVPTLYIVQILLHCQKYPENIYVFQTKNPMRYHEFTGKFPPRTMLGTTVETNRDTRISFAPPPAVRCGAMASIYLRKFITIEPVLDFDVDELLRLLLVARPSFVNIGADSKGHGLDEPTPDKIEALIKGLKKHGIEIKQKRNLERLQKGQA